jgi:hypothetical protein
MKYLAIIIGLIVLAQDKHLGNKHTAVRIEILSYISKKNYYSNVIKMKL